MPDPEVTVVVPTLAADSALLDCLSSLERQSWRGLDVVVVDNSGARRVAELPLPPGVRVIENASNVGFGAAINQGFRSSRAEFLAALNDDAVAHPGWVAALLGAARSRDDVGMCASQVRMSDGGALDSAGMLMARDGTSKQCGHGRAPEHFAKLREALLPSGSAALYRRAMLDDVGWFDEDFFLYCEDTDLGLRGRWAGWTCLYVPGAVVEHRYSHTAGRVSPLKASLVERNRLFVIVKNFPAPQLALALVAAPMRYVWHVVWMLRGRGAAREYTAGAPAVSLLWFVVRAHLQALAALPLLWRKRRAIRRRLTRRQFARLLASHRISLSEVASL